MEVVAVTFRLQKDGKVLAVLGPLGSAGPHRGFRAGLPFLGFQGLEV